MFAFLLEKRLLLSLKTFELGWFGDHSSHGENASTEGTTIDPLCWKMRLPPGHFGALCHLTKKQKKKKNKLGCFYTTETRKTVLDLRVFSGPFFFLDFISFLSLSFQNFQYISPINVLFDLYLIILF